MVTQTIKLYLHKAKTEDTFGYIYMRVLIPGTKRYKPKSLGHKIDEAHWDATNEIVLKGCPDYDIINANIKRKKLELKHSLQSVENEGKDITATVINEKLKRNKKQGTFVRFFKTHKDYIKGKHSPGYGKHWESEYNRLVNYAGEDVAFNDITMEWLQEYETYLRTGDEVTPGLAGTTMNTVFKRLKEVVDLAIQREHISPKQIAGFKWPGYEAPERPYLTLDETDKIYKSLPQMEATLQAVGAYFLVECYSGIRLSDWKKFAVERLIERDNFRVRTTKNKQPVYLPLKYFPRLKKVLDYIKKNELVIDLADQVINKYLKIVGSHAGIKIKLTTHIGRHTCGTLLGELGYNTRDIADVLGISEQTAKVYVKQTRQGLLNTVERYGGL